MVDSAKITSSSQLESSTRVKFSSIFETIDVTKRRTKIISTLGASCEDVDQIVKMIDAGMNIARLDFSQGDHKSIGVQVANLQTALKQRPDKQVALMLETRGPELLTGSLKSGMAIEVKEGQVLEILTDATIEGDETKIACDYKSLSTTVQVGSAICLGDAGAMVTCLVTEIGEVSTF